jgi:hypothetical protein
MVPFLYIKKKGGVMPVIKRYIDLYWHESNLIILILNKGSLHKDELFRKITMTP